MLFQFYIPAICSVCGADVFDAFIVLLLIFSAITGLIVGFSGQASRAVGIVFMLATCSVVYPFLRSEWLNSGRFEIKLLALGITLLAGLTVFFIMRKLVRISLRKPLGRLMDALFGGVLSTVVMSGIIFAVFCLLMVIPSAACRDFVFKKTKSGSFVRPYAAKIVSSIKAADDSAHADVGSGE